MQPLEELDLDLFTKEGKPRKRRRKTDRNYFTQDTQEAIILYRDSDDIIFRNTIYRNSIHFSVDKLVENIINTYKFPYAETHAGGFEDLKHETICKVMSEMPKYDQSKGKAYSYFGTIAKRFLIQYNDKQFKRHKKQQEIDSYETEVKVDHIRHEGDADSDLQDFAQYFADWVEEGINDWFYIFEEGEEKAVKFTDSEKTIVKEILKFFRTVSNLEIFYKPAFYLQLRDTTKQKTHEITRVINVLKESFEEQLYEYQHRGELKVQHKDVFSPEQKDPTKTEEDEIEEYFTV